MSCKDRHFSNSFLNQTPHKNKLCKKQVEKSSLNPFYPIFAMQKPNKDG